MATLTPETVAAFGYVLVLVMAPTMAGVLAFASRGQRTRGVSLAFAAVLLALWAPLVLAAPRVLATLVGA